MENKDGVGVNMKYVAGFVTGGNLVVSLLGLGAVFAMFGLFLFVLLDILSRIFIFPLAGTTEITELLLGASAFLSLGYAQQAGMHVRVAVITSRLRPKSKAIIDAFVDVISVALFTLITWYVAKATYEMWEAKTAGYGTIQLPDWVGSFMAMLGCTTLGLAVLIGLVSRIARLSANQEKK